MTESTQIQRLEAKYEEIRAERDRRKQDHASKKNPLETANAFWEEFNEKKTELMNIFESTEGLDPRIPSVAEEANGSLNKAAKLVCNLQEFTAKSTLFLTPYDQRLANSVVMDLHQAVAALRQRLFPRNSFTFKSRRCKPLSLNELIYDLRKQEKTSHDECKAQESEPRDKIDAQYSFVDAQGATLKKVAGEVQDGDFVLSRLNNCTIWICDMCGALRGDSLKNCMIFVGPVRSVLLEHVENCIVYVAAQQLRIHSAKDCDFYVRTRSGPIIEHSERVRFAPYELNYPDIQQHLAAAGLDQDSGHWAKVEDFNWLKSRHSPNWSVLPPDQRRPKVEFDAS